MVSTDVSMQTSCGARRLGFGKVAAVLHELVQLLLATGCSAVLDMDDICQRESLEVIGRVCFGTEFGALRYCLVCAGFISDGLPRRTPSSLPVPAGQRRDATCQEGAAAGVKLLHDAMEELLRQLTNPLRYKLMWLCRVRSQVTLWCLLFLEAAPDQRAACAHGRRRPGEGEPCIAGMRS